MSPGADCHNVVTKRMARHIDMSVSSIGWKNREGKKGKTPPKVAKNDQNKTVGHPDTD